MTKYMEWCALVLLHWALTVAELMLLFHYTFSPLQWFCQPHGFRICLVFQCAVAACAYQIHFYCIQWLWPHRYATESVFLYEDRRRLVAC